MSYRYWEHVDKEEVIISEEGLDEAIHNAYLKGRNDVLEKIRDEILNFKEKCNASDYLGCGILEIIDKYRGE